MKDKRTVKMNISAIIENWKQFNTYEITKFDERGRKLLLKQKIVVQTLLII